jgi:pimeloyl-ACP methyl ester carboxylesterase
MKIVLVHGLSRTPLSLLSLEGRLRAAGWQTEQFSYAAMLESYERIALRLHRRLQDISSREPYGIVAHSLGGLLTRSALALSQINPPDRIVMLGTPNRQPRLAAYAWQMLLPFRWWTRECGYNLTNPDFFAQLPRPASPYTIIAGTQGLRGVLSPFGNELNDGIVALSETKISDTDAIVQLPVNHTFMMNDSRVQATVMRSLAQVAG